jgi:uncharacterized membrane protein (UPF0127 family)
MSNPRIPRKPGQPANSKKHSDLYTDENPKGTIHGLGFKDVATAKASVTKIRNSSRSHAHKIQAAVAMEQRAREMGKTSEAAVYRKYINSMKKKTKEMNEEMNGKCKAGYYYCYTDKKCKPIPKGYKMVGRAGYLRKENGHSVDDEPSNGNGNGNGGNGNGNGGNGNGGNGGGMSEESLRDWFGKSRSKGGKPGWVQVVSGKPCARQPGQKSTPKCVSSAKRASMSKSERESAQRRKRAADPGQPQKTGAAKPTYVSTDKPKKKMDEAVMRDKQGLDKYDRSKRMIRHMQDKYGSAKSGFGPDSKFRTGKDHSVANEKKMKSVKESTEFVTLPLDIEIPNNIRDFNLGLMFRESLDVNSGMLFIFDEVAQQSFHMTETRIPLDIAFIREDGIIDSIKPLEPFDESPVTSDGEVLCALEVNRGWFAENNVEIGDEIDIEEGKKDACYHKVKSRYSVWPSAYASGALVKCRKVGAANWGTKTKKEEFELEEKKGQKCWPGYEKKGTQKLFGKTYNRCVKKEEVTGGILVQDAQDFKPREIETVDIIKAEPLVKEEKGCMHNHKGEECPVHGKKECPAIEEAVRMPAKTGNLVNVVFRFRSSTIMLKMFFPQVSLPTRSDVQDQIGRVYPGAKLLNFTVSDYEPGEPVLHAEGAAWTKKSGKAESGGLNEKGRKSYERENPGSDLKAPSKKVGNPRRKSFCARMKGMKKKLTSAKTANDPNSRINKSLRAWNC